MGKMELKRNILEYERSTGRKLSSCDDCSTRPSLRPVQNENGKKTILKCPRKKQKSNNAIVFKTASGVDKKVSSSIMGELDLGGRELTTIPSEIGNFETCNRTLFRQEPIDFDSARDRKLGQIGRFAFKNKQIEVDSTTNGKLGRIEISGFIF